MAEGAIRRFLTELENELRRRGWAEAPSFEELEDHLLCAAEVEEALGCAREEAERRAVEQFGTPAAYVASCERELSGWKRSLARRKWICTLLAVFNGYATGSWLHHGVRSFGWSDNKLAFVFTVILFALSPMALLAMHARSLRFAPSLRRILLPVAMSTVILLQFRWIYLQGLRLNDLWVANCIMAPVELSVALLWYFAKDKRAQRA